MPQTQNKPAAKPSNQGARRRSKVFLLVLVAVFAWGAVKAFDQLGRIQQKNAELVELKGKLAEATKVNDDVKLELKRLQDPEYLKEQIRSQLNYSEAGETVFEVPRSR
ncbi:septum formation initiator family protein [Paenibacillus aurantius]|uniref:Septum formation initiator family protein n=1 Tax=Paenibacillus aurantius TaxID=2918900 RepID=A0AA96LE45_9BACL|nr:septum formation initiator family protein [Paenibacillus aurantius]WJH36378.1 septum formation initiator family protein [Paenibacillus sp. CC-CFT747]WNQ11685.1 septum formation initiator family protein [Paenibacillus aurantius]